MYCRYLYDCIWTAKRDRREGACKIRLPYKLFLAGSLFLLPLFLGIRVQKNLYVCFLDVSQEMVFLYRRRTIYGFWWMEEARIKRIYTRGACCFLKSRGVDALDFAVVTHPDEDHISALKELIEQEEISLYQLLLPRISEQLQDEAYNSLRGACQTEGSYSGLSVTG